MNGQMMHLYISHTVPVPSHLALALGSGLSPSISSSPPRCTVLLLDGTLKMSSFSSSSMPTTPLSPQSQVSLLTSSVRLRSGPTAVEKPWIVVIHDDVELDSEEEKAERRGWKGEELPCMEISSQPRGGLSVDDITHEQAEKETEMDCQKGWPGVVV